MAGLTINDPVEFWQALLSANVIPGDTLLLRGGTYPGNTVNWSGSSGLPITIKSYPGEQATIDGRLTINGSYIRLIGLESKNSIWRDRSVIFGTEGFTLQGDHIEVVNCIIHDQDQGITAGATKTGDVFYGNVIYFNGATGNNGHGIYAQNNDGNAKTIKRNIIFDNASYGIHCWGSVGDVSDFVIDGNTCFENGAPSGAYQDNILNGNSASFTSPRIFNNMTYNVSASESSGLQIGYGAGNTALDVQVYDNYLANKGTALSFLGATISRFNGNALMGILSGAALGDNTQQDNYPVSGSHVILTNNEYDANRAQLTIYNWALANTIEVDVSAVYANGTILSVRNVQDYFTDIQTLTVTAGKITINMQAVNRTVATPIGWTAPAKTFPQFGAFVLEVA